jgi:hypothetical protein
MNQPDGFTFSVDAALPDSLSMNVQHELRAGSVVVDITQPVPSIVGQHYVIDDTHEAEVFGPEHPIVAGIIELEVQQLIDLGDREDESRAWLIDRTGCAWIALFERGAARVASNVLGIVRVTGSAASDRVLNDLALLQRSTPEDVEARICAFLGVESIRPFVDLTTLDITKKGAETRRAQAHNFTRLLTVLTIAGIQLSVRREMRYTLALVHPHMWKSATRLGLPFDDPGFGCMEYKLTAKNINPMQTQLIAQNVVSTVNSIRSGSRPFMTEIGRIAALNGIDVDQVVTEGTPPNRLNPLVSAATPSTMAS